jgi:predicted DNA-binding protein
MTDERENRLRRLMEATGENTKAGAIDIAVKHYLTDLEQKRQLVDEISPELAEELSTGSMPIQVETSVGSE